MSKADYEKLLADVSDIFESVLGVPGRPFGAKNQEWRGVSDDAEGVQWNIAVSVKSGETRLGVNLEGMTYKDWPIASFIEVERETLAFPSLSKAIPHADEIVISFLRDAWQRASRPNIVERHIGKGEVPLSLLSKPDWLQMLAEAYDCLDETKGHRGRAKQIVTKSTGQAEMEVSPHLYIYTQVRTNTASLKQDVEAAFARLNPIYEIVKSESENQKPTRWKETLDTILDAPQLVTPQDLSPPDTTRKGPPDRKVSTMTDRRCSWNTTARQRGDIIGCWLTDLRGGFTIEEHAKATFPFRPNLERAWEGWLQGASRTAAERVKNGIWEKLPDGRYKAVEKSEP